MSIIASIQYYVKYNYWTIITILLLLILVALFAPSPVYGYRFYKPAKRILLISTNISELTYQKDIEQYLIDTNDIKYVYYDFDEINGYLDLLNKIHEIMDEHPLNYESIGIMFHTEKPNTLKLFKRDKNVIETTSNEKTDRDQYDTFNLFARAVKEMGTSTKRHTITDLDLISCELLPLSGKSMFKYISQRSGINVNASTDPSGEGADWYLEEGNRNLIGLYFNPTISHSGIKLIA
jgi:hypothetical protein